MGRLWAGRRHNMYSVAITHADNYRLDTVKAAVKTCFDALGLPEHNPLGGIIRPSDTVFIKPNWVASRWRASGLCRANASIHGSASRPSGILAL